MSGSTVLRQTDGSENNRDQVASRALHLARERGRSADRAGERRDQVAAPMSAEQRVQDLGITLPAPPEPFGSYVEAVRTGHLLFLSGMLPTEGKATFTGRVGAEHD